MASLDDIASAMGMDKKRANGTVRLGKVTAKSGSTLSVKVDSSTIDCADFCGASVGSIVLVQALPNGTCVATAYRR